jgi:hypothetical protein
VELEQKRYELVEDVNRVRIGSLVIDEKGYETSDAREQAMLDEHPAVREAKTAAKNAAKTEASA